MVLDISEPVSTENLSGYELAMKPAEYRVREDLPGNPLRARIDGHSAPWELTTEVGFKAKLSSPDWHDSSGQLVRVTL